MIFWEISLSELKAELEECLVKAVNAFQSSLEEYQASIMMN